MGSRLNSYHHTCTVFDAILVIASYAKQMLQGFVCFLVGGVHVTLVYPEHIRVGTVVGRFELGLILTDLLPFVITRLGLFSKYRLLL